MAIIVRNTNYSGEVLEQLLTLAATSNEIVEKGLIMVIPGVEKKISLTVRFERKITVAEAREAIAAAPGCLLRDDVASGIYPMPLDTSDQDKVFVGRIREDLTDPCGLTLWCCGDQLRKGAATNAVQIALAN